MRKEATDIVLEAVAKPGSILNETNIRSALSKVVPCQSCTTRLFRTFKQALYDFGLRGSVYGIGKWQGKSYGSQRGGFGNSRRRSSSRDDDSLFRFFLGRESDDGDYDYMSD